jgi:hypothetical protein
VQVADLDDLKSVKLSSKVSYGKRKTRDANAPLAARVAISEGAGRDGHAGRCDQPE